MKNQFAKLFEFDEHQVLARKSNQEGKEEAYEVELITYHNGTQGKISYGYNSEERRDKNFENIGRDQAKLFLNSTLLILS